MFWSDSYAFQEPLRQHRWFIEGINSSDKILYSLKECSKPSYSINVAECRLLNEIYRFPGVKTWKPIKIKMAGTIYNREAADSTSYFFARPTMFMEQQPFELIKDAILSKKTLIKSFVQGDILSLIQIDDQGIPIETWKLKNPFFSDVEFGNLSYESDGLVDINITVQYDYATMDFGNTDETKNDPYSGYEFDEDTRRLVTKKGNLLNLNTGEPVPYLGSFSLSYFEEIGPDNVIKIKK